MNQKIYTIRALDELIFLSIDNNETIFFGKFCKNVF